MTGFVVPSGNSWKAVLHQRKARKSRTGNFDAHFSQKTTDSSAVRGGFRPSRRLQATVVQYDVVMLV
jgi:hypothetical protein